MSALHIVMTAAHGGYDLEKQPLGGAAAICERLCALWGEREDLRLTLLGSGPLHNAAAGVEYKSFPASRARLPSTLNEWDYARFCRDFEKATTEYVLGLSERPVVISHDISEGPNFRRLALAGVRCIPIFHVDVVDYFNRFYLGDLLSASWWTALHRGWRGLIPLPDILKLVFEKQLYALEHCPYVVVPSPPMEGVLRRCYPQLPQGRVQILPWGAPLCQPAPEQVEEAKTALLDEWGLGENHGPILLTLSRIGPEKNQALLLDALRCGEDDGQVPPGLTVVIAGEAAYMGGERYRRKLEIKAGRLRSTRVIFAGHLGGARKRAVFEMAQLFVVPSRHESYGLTSMEAMAAGLPVVGVATQGVEAAVSRDSGVLLAPVKNLAGDLWLQILRLLKSPEELARLRRGAVQSAKEATFNLAADGLLALANQLTR